MKINLEEKAMLALLKEINSSDDALVARIDIEGFSWSGPEFSLALDEQEDDDIITNVEGINIAISEDISDVSNEFTIDYNAGQFEVTNPNSSGSC